MSEATGEDSTRDSVTELTLQDHGVWRVWTQGSSHILDLEKQTVTRVSGEGRPTSINDATRPLRTLEACRVGAPGGLLLAMRTSKLLPVRWPNFPRAPLNQVHRQQNLPCWRAVTLDAGEDPLSHSDANRFWVLRYHSDAWLEQVV